MRDALTQAFCTKSPPMATVTMATDCAAITCYTKEFIGAIFG